MVLFIVFFQCKDFTANKSAVVSNYHRNLNNKLDFCGNYTHTHPFDCYDIKL